MKIAIIVSMFPPKWLGGTEIATQNTAIYLAKKGIEVHVLTVQDKDLPKEKKEAGFFVYRMFYPKIKILGVLLFWIKIIISLKKINPEIIHSQGIQMAVPCFLAKKLFKKPYIVYCRGSDVYLPWKFKNFISKLVLNDADAVVVLSEDMKKKIQIIYHKDIFVIPNGIDCSRFNDLSKIDIRDKLKIGVGEKIILFVGTLKAVKGIKYLIQTVGIVKEKIPGIVLLLVGDGKQKKELEKMIESLNLGKNIFFSGKVLNEQIPKYMIASDIFVLPSLSESFGIVNLEAMASGLPIVATKVGGIPELVKDGENGFLVEPKNPEQIAEKILYLFSNDELRKKISQKNIEKAKNYSWDLVTEKLVKVYELCKSKV